MGDPSWVMVQAFMAAPGWASLGSGGPGVQRKHSRRAGERGPGGQEGLLSEGRVMEEPQGTGKFAYSSTLCINPCGLQCGLMSE